MSGTAATETPHLEQIDLTTFNLPQLTLMKQELDQELGVFQDSWQTLKMAQSKYKESGSCLEKFTPSIEGKIYSISVISTFGTEHCSAFGTFVEVRKSEGCSTFRSCVKITLFQVMRSSYH